MPSTAPHPILRIVLPYAAFATLWIYASDSILGHWVTDLQALTRVQTYKGLAFIFVTAALLYVLLRRELTLRERADSDRARVRRRLIEVLESITDGFISLDRAWRFTYVNQRAANMLRRPARRLLGKVLGDQFPEVVDHPFYHVYEKAMTQHVPQTIEAYYPPWDRWFENRVYPTPEGIAIFFRDVTERTLTEQRLRETEERFRATFEQAAVGIAHVALDGRWLRVNRKLCDIVGYSSDELRERTFQDITHPDDLDVDLAQVRRMLAGEIDTYSMEKRYLRKNGSIVWVELTVSLVHDSARTPKYFISVVEEISRRHEAEAALRLSEERFRRMAESTAAAIFIVQGERLRFVNPQAVRMTGYTREQLMEMDGWMLMHPRFREQARARAAARLRGEPVSPRVEMMIVRRDGAERWVDMSATVIEYDGAPAILGTAYDITERKAAEADLQRAHDELEQRVTQRTSELQRTNAALQAFTDMVSHDLHAPLRTMQGFARALREDYSERMPREGREYVQRIANAAERMDQLIRDLLTYSTVDRAQLKLETVDLARIVAQALAVLDADIQLRRAAVKVEVSVPPVRAEPTFLAQILCNLLSNAIKFTQPGIDPLVRIHGERRDGRARLSVTDNGIGIPPAERDRIFKPFERLHGIEAYPGTGIGLAIVQKAVERMNGAVGVESRPGAGSQFWIELPLAKDESA